MTEVLAAGSLLPGPPGPGWIAVDDGTLVERGSGRPPRGAADLGSLALAPGFLDLQVNGIGTDDLAGADDGGWDRVGSALLRHGVTSYCATFVTAPLDAYAASLDRADRARARAAADPHVADVLGVHLEGPFLGGAPGAHDPRLVREADAGWVARVLADHEGLVRIVTLAPEADPDLAVTRLLAGAGVVVALGHSTAPYESAVDAADAGATVVTHLFNGMAPLHHRAPGLVGAALVDPRLVPTLIADGVHVHPAVVRLVSGSDGDVALVSDAVAVETGVDVASGAARRADGTLVGATALLDDAVRRVVGLGVPLSRAVSLVTDVPARVLGLTDRGRLEPGARADVVALDPATGALQRVWRAGHAVAGDG